MAPTKQPQGSKLGVPMNADQTIAMYETRRKLAALNGDEVAEAHWVDRINRVSDQIEAARRQSKAEVQDA